MNAEELRHSRIQNFKNVITGKGHIDHIPQFGNYWSWKYYDSGYSLTEALFDYSKMQDAIGKFADKYPMDVIYETGWRNPLQITTMLGKKNDYIIDDEIFGLSIKDQDWITEDDYDGLIANPEKFLWETFIPRKFTNMALDENSEYFARYTGEMGKFGAAMGNIAGMLASKGIADLFDPNSSIDAWGFGYELLFNCMRGMKGMAIDLRRCPDKLYAACKALDELFEKPRYERGLMGPDGSNEEYMVDISPVLLGHIILSVKDFERFYLPHLKLANDYLVSKDKVSYIFIEGSFKRFWDIFRDFPKDHISLQMELDDVFETKKALPNIVVGGGMPSEILGLGTVDEALDYTKKLVDELGGDDHRYIFAPNKMISYPKDCNSDNLAAICKYLNSIHY